VKECKAFSSDYATREKEIAAHYADPISGAIPSAANQLECKTNPTVG